MTSAMKNIKRSKKIHHAHNNAFQLAMTDTRVAKDMLNHHLPEKIRKMVKLDTLELEDGSFVDDELRTLHTDILYSVELADSPDHKRAYIYVHIEHQSDGDPIISFRMIKYCVRIIDRHLQNNNTNILPVIIPLVIYNGKQVFSDCLSVFDLFGEHKELAKQYMFNTFQLVDFHTIPDEEIRTQQWSCLLEMIFKHIHSRDMMTLLEEMTEIFRRFLQEKAENHILGMLKYVIEKSSIENRERFLTWVSKNLPKHLEKEAMTLAEQWKSEGIQIGMQQGIEKGVLQGIQQGMQQGIQQGTLEGEKTILKRLLNRRFGQIPDMYMEKIDNADSSKLLEWGDKIIDAKSLREIFENYH